MEILEQAGPGSVFFKHLGAKFQKICCSAPTMVMPLWIQCMYWSAQRNSGYITEKGNIQPKMKNKNYIPDMPYHRNSIAYNHDFLYTCGNDDITRRLFHFFKILIFWVVSGVKGQKMAQNDQKLFFLKKIVIHSVQDLTATTRHGVARKRSTKD